MLSSYTLRTCEIDLRLRPNESGLLVSDHGVCRIPAAAPGMEHQALTRARFSAGMEIGAAFDIRRQVLCQLRDLATFAET
jgi:glutamine synthetase adenylyltransferase